MVDDLRKYLNHLLEKVNGLHCILITDRDGVPLVRAVTERAPQLALRPNFISTFGMATDQASKLGLGRNKTIISMYSSYQTYACLVATS
ncbi:putative mitogen-activated protein kinase kinase 1 interacting protein 1 [Operophtera brumata]|uniref:Putative mitogen-activated protein kinase kinase 1 interacting protein 1 n=1 Tax=Operophtera brumata TaxID=104452 RepID=A0A0L7KRV2_OPEBR|nr:putative mitogen-activated protein kinase kinase 1 interacting protein 1 [Operophtera brumata]